MLFLDWGVEAFKIDHYYFWVPALIPIIGAVLGAIIYELVVGIHADGAGGQSRKEISQVENEEATLPTYDKVADLKSEPPSYASSTTIVKMVQ